MLFLDLGVVCAYCNSCIESNEALSWPDCVFPFGRTINLFFVGPGLGRRRQPNFYTLRWSRVVGNMMDQKCGPFSTPALDKAVGAICKATGELGLDIANPRATNVAMGDVRSRDLLCGTCCAQTMNSDMLAWASCTDFLHGWHTELAEASAARCMTSEQSMSSMLSTRRASASAKVEGVKACLGAFSPIGSCMSSLRNCIAARFLLSTIFWRLVSPTKRYRHGTLGEAHWLLMKQYQPLIHRYYHYQ